MKRKIISILFAVVLVLSFSLVTAVPVAANTDRLVPSQYATIQLAIDAAGSGDTITVAAGTYNENITIDKSLTVVSVDGADVTIINAQGVPIAVLINGADTVATFDGFTVDDYDTIGILAGAFRDVLQGVQLGDDPIAVHLLNNIVKPPTVAPPHNNNIQVGDGTTGTVIGNEVSGALLESPDWSGSGILVAASSDVVVSNNYVHNSEGGIQILGYADYRGGPAAVSNLIENNLVEGNECGISVQGNSIGTIIRCNDVLNNDTGIGSLAYDFSWEQSTPSDTEVHCNNIVGNENYGVTSSVWWHHTGEVLAEQVDATNNWWGNASGPYHPDTNTDGLGDTVSDYVDYEPWSYTPDPCEPKSKGFWKNHPDSLDAVLDDVSVLLGTYEVTDAETAEPVFSNERAKCAESMLAAQLLAAKLNVAHLTHLGISTACITSTIDDADTALSGSGYNGPGTEWIKGKDKQAMLVIKNVLDDFNNGGCGGYPCDWD